MSLETICRFLRTHQGKVPLGVNFYTDFYRAFYQRVSQIRIFSSNIDLIFAKNLTIERIHLFCQTSQGGRYLWASISTGISIGCCTTEDPKIGFSNRFSSVRHLHLPCHCYTVRIHQSCVMYTKTGISPCFYAVMQC